MLTSQMFDIVREKMKNKRLITSRVSLGFLELVEIDIRLVCIFASQKMLLGVSLIIILYMFWHEDYYITAVEEFYIVLEFHQLYGGCYFHSSGCNVQ